MADSVGRIETTLKELLCCRIISDQQYVLMHPSRLSVQMNYLYFVPDTDKKGVPVEPVVICKDGSTMRIFRSLSRVLWSIIDQVISCKSFTSEPDAVLALEWDRRNGHPRPATLLAIFNVHQVCTMFPHDATLSVVEQWLDAHGSSQQRTCGLPHETIIRLVRLVSKNHFFVYQQQLYRQNSGGGSSSPANLPSVCFHTFHGLSGLITALSNNKHELFGGYGCASACLSR